MRHTADNVENVPKPPVFAPKAPAGLAPNAPAPKAPEKEHAMFVNVRSRENITAGFHVWSVYMSDDYA